MRNPSLILAATLVMASYASAATDAWRNVRFTDETGQEHSVWCKTAECGPAAKGSAALYVFDNDRTATMTSEEGYLWWKKTTTATTKSFDARASSYSLQLGAAPKAVLGTAKSFPATFQQALPAQVTLNVKTLALAADDLPTALSDAEKYWLGDTERKAYDTNAARALKPEERVKLQTMTRGIVGKHLPSFARPKYTAMTTTGTFDPKKVSQSLDDLISIKNPDDSKKLLAVKKGKGAGAHLQRDDALEEYNGVMQTVKRGPDGRPVAEQRDYVVQKIAWFRGMLQGKPGTGGPAKPPRKPGEKPQPPAGVVVDLTAQEQDWLTPEELNVYREKLGAKPKDADRIALNKTNRDLVRGNLPDNYRSSYDSAVAEMTPMAIDGAVSKFPHWSGDQAELIPGEVEALTQITKEKNPAVKGATAQADYKEAFRHLFKGPDGLFKGSLHLTAHKITLQYRQMLADAGIKVPNAPVPTTPAKPGEQPKPGEEPKPGDAKPADPKERPNFKPKDDDDLKAAYEADIAKANGDKDQIAKINQQYNKLMEPRIAFRSMSPSEMQEFCAPYKNSSSGGGAAAGGSCSEPGALATKTADCNKNRDCIARVTAECGDTPAAPASTPAGPSGPPPLTDAFVKGACAAINNNNGTMPDPGNNAGSGGTPAKGDIPSPCSSTKGGSAKKDAPAGGAVNPSGQAGTDKDTDCSTAEKKPDPAFWKNMSVGMSFGVFGLIVGSFFGGPLAMVAAAAVLGGGAFALSHHFNPKPKDDGGS